MAIPKVTPKPVTAPKAASTTGSTPSSTTANKAPSSTTAKKAGGVVAQNTREIGEAIRRSLSGGFLGRARINAPDAKDIRSFANNATPAAAAAATKTAQPSVPLTKGVSTTAQTAAASATQGTAAVDFNKMTTDQQYDYLRDTAVKQAGGDPNAWKTGDGEVNLVGIRSFQNGKGVAAEGDKYNDTVYVCRMKDGKKEVHPFDATTDAGVWNDAKGKGMSLVDGMGRDHGVTHLADGFYKESFGVGQVSGGEQGLQQKGWVRLNADKNNDGKIQDSERLGRNDNGFLAGADWQIQFHRGGVGDKVGETSAGCQAIKGDQYDKFMGLINEAPNKGALSYSLTDSSKLEQPGFDVGEKKNWWQLDITQRQSQSNGSGLFAGFLGALNPKAKGRGVINEDAGDTIVDSSQDITFQDQDKYKHHHNHHRGPDGHGIIVTPRPSVTFSISSWYKTFR